MIKAMSASLTKEVDVMKRIAATKRDEKVSLDQVPPSVKATIERESAGGQVTGISQAAERGEAAYAVKIAKDGQKMTIYLKADGTVLNGGCADDNDDDE
jgi:uncharacterized membrane protein YkoI